MAKKSIEHHTRPLLQAFLSLTTEHDIFLFLRDLCTVEEINEFVQRLEIARLLSEKKSYKEIEKITGVSSTTIARVAKFLHGKRGGYQKVLAAALR